MRQLALLICDGTSIIVEQLHNDNSSKHSKKEWSDKHSLHIISSGRSQKRLVQLVLAKCGRFRDDISVHSE
jgi:hypothetical protein